MEMFADNTRIQHGNDKNWRELSIYRVPEDTQVLCVVGTNVPDHNNYHGILGSTSNGLLTNETWKCSNHLYPGWKFPDFDDQDWPSVKVVGINGDSPWGKIGGIAGRAKWIWAKNYNDTVYCRLKLK